MRGHEAGRRGGAPAVGQGRGGAALGGLGAAGTAGGYWHLLPQASQGRKAIWDAVNPHTGLRRIEEAFGEHLSPTFHDSEMKVTFGNGSTWQVLGSDNHDSLMGASVVGVVFSEWSLARPDAWAYIRPILLESAGSTPSCSMWTMR